MKGGVRWWMVALLAIGLGSLPLTAAAQEPSPPAATISDAPSPAIPPEEIMKLAELLELLELLEDFDILARLEVDR
ncbi:MAG: hypothetical protein IH614_15060 [Desulfuromonadales bacterium]|nr:hypothetical protein [Desulfuromonadales bacterium]